MDSHIPRRQRGALRLGLLAASALLLQACGDSGGGGPATIGVASLAGSAMPAASDCSPFTTPAQFAGSVPTPRSVLNFDLGSRAVSNEEANLYLDRIDAASDRVVTGEAASWWQADLNTTLKLRYAIVGSASNLKAANLDKLRKTARQLMDPDTTPELAASMPAILWVAGNVHGNEKSGADAALRVLYELAAREDCVASRIRDNAVVVILPIQNPYGRAVGTRRSSSSTPTRPA
jgi:hypothetical protein